MSDKAKILESVSFCGSLGTKAPPSSSATGRPGCRDCMRGGARWRNLLSPVEGAEVVERSELAVRTNGSHCFPVLDAVVYDGNLIGGVP